MLKRLTKNVLAAANTNSGILTNIKNNQQSDFDKIIESSRKRP